MVCHNEMDMDYIDELTRVIETEGAPDLTKFGVLTSGTTGRPKPLWVTFMIKINPRIHPQFFPRCSFLSCFFWLPDRAQKS